MTRPRILLVPTLTELEWRIRPLLEDWAEVACYDAPGVGDEPAVDHLTVEAVAARGVREIERREWDRCVVVGDEFGTRAALLIASAARERMAGLALGHASLSWAREGDRPAISPKVYEAYLKLGEAPYRTAVRTLTQVTAGAYDDEMVERYMERVPEELNRTFSPLSGAGAEEENAALLRELGAPLFLVEHTGCLLFTPEAFEDAVAAFPDARTARVDVKPSASPEFAEALRAFCEELAPVPG